MDQPAFATAVISATVALAVAIFTNSAAARRSHDDRIWLRKAAAYSAILDALYQMDEVLSVWWNEYIEGKDDPSPEVAEERRQTFVAARRQLYSTVQREVWSLPVEVWGILERLREALDAGYESYFHALDSRSAAAERALRTISETARRDMARPDWLERLRTSGRPSPGPPTT